LLVAVVAVVVQLQVALELVVELAVFLQEQQLYQVEQYIQLLLVLVVQAIQVQIMAHQGTIQFL
jgi:hypothetical protein